MEDPSTVGSDEWQPSSTKNNSLEIPVHFRGTDVFVGCRFDSDMPQDQEGNPGDNDDEPRKEDASRREWFKKPTPPQEPTYHD
ncbi:hypothetical protein Tco_1327843 [Tanacetum coccineum]